LTPRPTHDLQNLYILSYIGKSTGLALTFASPFQATPTGLIIFAAASLLKDTVNRLGDLADDGQSNGSFNP